MSLGLVSCTKRKRSVPCKAFEMYSVSPLFRKAYEYSIKVYQRVTILSAKYGLLLPDDWIEPYDLTLRSLNKRKRIVWADNVLKQMKERVDLNKVKKAYFHCGKEYRDFLIPKLKEYRIECQVPLKGLSIGKQLAWYKKNLPSYE